VRLFASNANISSGGATRNRCQFDCQVSEMTPFADCLEHNCIGFHELKTSEQLRDQRSLSNFLVTADVFSRNTRSIFQCSHFSANLRALSLDLREQWEQ
jgi:hypothetical protein